MDIKAAFRLLPVYPGDFNLLGFKIDSVYFIDKCMPMGFTVISRVSIVKPKYSMTQVGPSVFSSAIGTCNSELQKKYLMT
jgi:hypothetical protein